VGAAQFRRAPSQTACCFCSLLIVKVKESQDTLILYLIPFAEESDS
jgi:hypothetical protein